MYGGYRGGGGGGSFNNRNRDQPREMYKTTCSDCGNECEVPFKPTQGRPVYCRDCYSKHAPPREDRRRY